jgi:hypothetical protein
MRVGVGALAQMKVRRSDEMIRRAPSLGSKLGRQ